MGGMAFVVRRWRKKFDIRTFRDAMLSLGPVPLPLVDARVDQFIADGGRVPYRLK